MGKKRKHIKVGKLIPFLNKLKLWLKKFWWTLIVASLIVPVIKDYSSHVMNNHYDNSKEIVISDNDISNINNKTGMVESVTTNPKIFSNFILNSLTNVGFTVLVDKTCQLEYKVKIESGKKIITNNKSYNVMMRVPVYTQENSGFYGDFYEFLLKHNTELDKPISYNKKLISEFDKKLVFDKYKAARKFSKAQI